jgi:hypothetical protein
MNTPVTFSSISIALPIGWTQLEAESKEAIAAAIEVSFQEHRAGWPSESGTGGTVAYPAYSFTVAHQNEKKHVFIASTPQLKAIAVLSDMRPKNYNVDT